MAHTSGDSEVWEEERMANEQLALTAHLLRRAGFGATREELEAYAARPYEEVVDEPGPPRAHAGG